MRQKFLFIHVHKCAGTSIKEAVSKIDNVFYEELGGSDLIKHKISEEYFWFKKFTFVRNPYSRFLSAFKMFKRRWPDIKKEEVFEIIEDKSIPYTANFFNIKKSYIKRHTLPMSSEHYSICNKNGESNVDLILRFEKIEEEIKRLSEFLGADIRLPKLNSSKNNHTSLTQEDIGKINKIYHRDFEIFDYKMK